MEDLILWKDKNINYILFPHAMISMEHAVVRRKQYHEDIFNEGAIVTNVVEVSRENKQWFEQYTLPIKSPVVSGEVMTRTLNRDVYLLIKVSFGL